MKTLIVVDMQNDFITGPLGTPEAVAIVPKVKQKIEEYISRDEHVIFTRDCHDSNYLQTLEGHKLPVEHCIMHRSGWRLHDDLKDYLHMYENVDVIGKRSFGYRDWYRWDEELENDIEIIGLYSDICVISNALIIKANFPETEITVDASCCAGTTPENHKAALQVMKSCQINVIGE